MKKLTIKKQLENVQKRLEIETAVKKELQEVYYASIAAHSQACLELAQLRQRVAELEAAQVAR
jgi:hypothetical protein